MTTPTLDYETYKDKVLAGWIGKSFGGVIGASLECHKELKSLAPEQIWPEKMLPNDDLDLQVVWLEAMQERGIWLTSDDLVDFWQDRCWYFFCEYGVFLNNVQRGIAPPLSGTWNNRFFLNSEGCPIRAEIWGFVAPNNPSLAAELARMDGQLDHGETSIQAEQFLAAAASQALLTDDLDMALAAGLSVIPADSPIALAVPRVRQIARQYPDPAAAWRVVIREFGHRNANDAIANHALTLLALFAGKGDMKRTMLLCANFGWDTDCTASTAGALLGALGGTASLPQDWVESLGKTLVTGIKVKHQGAPLSDFADDTCRVGVEMAGARNPNVRFSSAPAVTVRERLAPQIRLEVIYDGEPVLWKERASNARVRIHNPFSQQASGRLRVVAPTGVVCEGDEAAITVPAEKFSDVPISIRRADAGGWLPDKNLFEARWEDGGDTKASRTFGLGGARQWQVYGPYWDMWDKTKIPVCPYNNDQLVAGPFHANLTGDCYNEYAELDRAYLDESLLLREDIAGETPLLIEHGEDLLTQDQLGGFTGQACYYLVRTLRATVPDTATNLVIGRSGPCRVWLDGAELGSHPDMRCWTPLDDANYKIMLSGQPQRLVIKLIRLTDAFQFSAVFMCKGDPDYKRGCSNILDSLADQIPASQEK